MIFSKSFTLLFTKWNPKPPSFFIYIDVNGLQIFSSKYYQTSHSRSDIPDSEPWLIISILILGTSYWNIMRAWMSWWSKLNFLLLCDILGLMYSSWNYCFPQPQPHDNSVPVCEVGNTGCGSVAQVKRSVFGVWDRFKLMKWLQGLEQVSSASCVPFSFMNMYLFGSPRSEHSFVADHVPILCKALHCNDTWTSSKDNLCGWCFKMFILLKFILIPSSTNPSLLLLIIGHYNVIIGR